MSRGDETPMTEPSHDPTPVPSDPAEFASWMHRLRNEVNAAVMATAAARTLYDAGQPAQARLNLERAQGACQRCARMLSGSPPPPE